MEELTADQKTLISRICDSRVYPDTEAYSLHWIGGSSGAFVGSLMTYYIWPDRENFQLSSNNNSHDGLDGDQLNWDASSYQGGGIPGGHHDWMPPKHRYLRPADPSKLILMHDHVPADWSTLWQRWPQARAVVVSYRSSDTVEMAFNMYWKFFAQYHEDNDQGNAFMVWAKQERPEIFAAYDRPSDISVEDLRRYLWDGPADSEVIHDNTGGTFWGIEGNEPEDRRHLVFRVPYWRITRDPEWVLAHMSEFLGRPTTDQAREFYLRYIENQNRLIAEKAPWLREAGAYNVPMTD